MIKKFLAVSFITLSSLFFAIITFADSNWQLEEDNWYLYQDATVTTGWYYTETGTYYFGTDGALKTGWQKISGKQYLFRSDGLMHTGWWQEDNDWYYFQLDGTLLMDGVAPDGHKIDIDGKWNRFESVVDAREYLNKAYSPYIINWETDRSDVLVDSEITDMKVVSALLGRISTSLLSETEKEVYDLIKNFNETTLSPQDSDYEKVVKITRYIWRRGNNEAANGDSPYTLLINGNGSLTAYARTFKLMANAAGLECYYVYSNRTIETTIDNNDTLSLENLLSSMSGYYPWNIVKVEGHWYNAAITEIGNGASAPYILRCDTEFPAYIYKEGDSPTCSATTYTKSEVR